MASIVLQPPTFVPLSEEQERQAVNALAELLIPLIEKRLRQKREEAA